MTDDELMQSEEYKEALNSKENQEAFLQLKQSEGKEPKGTFQTVDNENLIYPSTIKPKEAEQKQPLPPIQINEDEALVQKATQPQKYRNTGIAYFDNKEHLSIADAFLAKYLGADIREIDMNVNANVKKTDVGKIAGELTDIFSAGKNMADSLEDYENAGNAGDYSARLGRWITDKTGGVINVSSEGNQKVLSNSVRDTYDVAKALSDGKTTNLDKEKAKDLVDNTAKTREMYYSGMLTGYEKLSNKANEKFTKAQAMGIPISQADNLKMQMLNSLKTELSKAQQSGMPLGEQFHKSKKVLNILNEKGDAGVAEALRMIYQ